MDHADPKSRGGNNTLDNAQNTCQTCNLDKGTKTTQEYLDYLNGGG
ncbi:MAG: HNH endonuclease [Oceanospirillaceae bacterium]|nr:HNH endonuclease [Oceanospirillaceae bacterium]